MLKKRLVIFLLIAIFMCVISLVSCSNIKTTKENTEKENTANNPPVTPAKAKDFELPINNATGYTSISMGLKAKASIDAANISTFKAGTAFRIIKEEGDWWFIQSGKVSGWLEHKFCLINLPDVIPSIIYDNTNTYSSKFLSSGKSIPGITGEALYESRAFNERLGKDEYIMPVLYSMAKKIFLAQQYALKEGNSLIIYETYRPNSVQKAILQGLTKLANSDSEVMKGISSPPWSLSWFIAKVISNHQRGCAIDVSLAKIESKIDTWVGPYTYPKITSFTEYTMPTKIHELSIAAVTFSTPVSSKSSTDWKNATLASSMNRAAVKLQAYCTSAGLTPLASEWWHFNDLNAMNETLGNSSDGSYFLTECYSLVP